LDHGRFLQLTFSRLRFGRAPGNSVVAVLHAMAQQSAPRRSHFDLRTVKPAALSSAAGAVRSVYLRDGSRSAPPARAPRDRAVSTCRTAL